MNEGFRRIGIILFFVGLVNLGAGCSSAPRAADSDTGEGSGPPPPYGPAQGEQAAAMGPDPVAIRPIVLVLGPSGAKGYAYAGVLRALVDAKIPIGAIVGSDMGALIGALFGMSTSINGFEWKMLQLKSEWFAAKTAGLGALFKQGNPRARLGLRLKELFAGKDLRDSRVPLKILNFSASLQDSGDVAAAVFEVLILPSAEANGVLNSPKAFPVAEARALGIGPVVVIDVLEHMDEPVAVADGGEREAAVRDAVRLAANRSVDELTQADLVIRPDLSKVKFTDFDRRSDAAYIGRTATVAAMDEIRGLTSNREGKRP